MLTRMWRNLNPHALLVEMQISIPALEKYLAHPQTLKILFNPAILLLGICQREFKQMLTEKKKKKKPAYGCS